MKDKIHFAESASDEKRWEKQFDEPHPAPTSVALRTTEDAVPARDRWKKKRRKVPKRIPGTMLIPNDVGEIDWS